MKKSKSFVTLNSVELCCICGTTCVLFMLVFFFSTSSAEEDITYEKEVAASAKLGGGFTETAREETRQLAESWKLRHGERKRPASDDQGENVFLIPLLLTEMIL